jgi:hypothetical protein
MLPCNAPSSCRKNTIYHETNTNFGNFNYNSLNFEHLLTCGSAKNTGLFIGAVYYSFPKIQSKGLRGGFNIMYGRYSNMFELGFGLTFLYVTQNYNNEVGKYKDNVSYAGLNGNIGFRHQNAEGGIFYKIGFTPMLSFMNYGLIPVIADNAFIPMGGISIGWTFK